MLSEIIHAGDDILRTQLGVRVDDNDEFTARVFYSDVLGARRNPFRVVEQPNIFRFSTIGIDNVNRAVAASSVNHQNFGVVTAGNIIHNRVQACLDIRCLVKARNYYRHDYFVLIFIVRHSVRVFRRIRRSPLKKDGIGISRIGLGLYA